MDKIIAGTSGVLMAMTRKQKKIALDKLDIGRLEQNMIVARKKEDYEVCGSIQ